jgi:hypothetical protein
VLLVCSWGCSDAVSFCDVGVRGSARSAISRNNWSKIGVDITLSRAMRALLNVKIRLIRTVTPESTKTVKPGPTRSSELDSLVGHTASIGRVGGGRPTG